MTNRTIHHERDAWQIYFFSCIVELTFIVFKCTGRLYNTKQEEGTLLH